MHGGAYLIANQPSDRVFGCCVAGIGLRGDGDDWKEEERRSLNHLAKDGAQCPGRASAQDA